MGSMTLRFGGEALNTGIEASEPVRRPTLKRTTGPMAPETDTARRPLSSTERMRLHRQRRQEQSRAIRVVLTASEINAFVKRGYLHPDSLNDSRAIGYAAMAFISDSLSGT
jgi:hypothetical protein